MKKSICICDICGKEIDATKVRHDVTIATVKGTSESVSGVVMPVTVITPGEAPQIIHYDVCSECLKKIPPKKEVSSEAKESVKEDSASEES